jgi:two-component system sensor histidine kinase DesK
LVPEQRSSAGTAQPDGTTQAEALRDHQQDGIAGSRLAPLLARVIVITVFCGLCLAAFLQLLYSPIALSDRVLSAAYMIALLLLQLYYLGPRPDRPRSATGYLVLTAQACLAFLPLFQFGQAWVGMPGFLAGSALLFLPTVLAWSTFAVIVVAMANIQWKFTGTTMDVMYTAVSTVITSLVVYGLSRLASLVTELHRARTEIARLAVAQERLRFSRDLHDLLGYSLSAITLKSELTHRLLPDNPVRARDEIVDILDISRRALSDVRSVASGYRELSLQNEAESARSLLLAANVDVRMELGFDSVPPELLTLLATIMREGVTNVLRHSKAEHCEILVCPDGSAMVIQIVNDGVPADPPETRPAGSNGIDNLSGRVRAANGHLSAGLDSDRRFRLYARIPLDTA